MQAVDIEIEMHKHLYVEEAAADTSFVPESSSSDTSPTPIGGPILQRSVLCNWIASFIFWNLASEQEKDSSCPSAPR